MASRASLFPGHIREHPDSHRFEILVSKRTKDLLEIMSPRIRRRRRKVTAETLAAALFVLADEFESLPWIRLAFTVIPNLNFSGLFRVLPVEAGIGRRVLLPNARISGRLDKVNLTTTQFDIFVWSGLAHSPPLSGPLHSFVVAHPCDIGAAARIVSRVTGIGVLLINHADQEHAANASVRGIMNC